MDVRSEVKNFVDENVHLELITDEKGKEKVQCKLTGHQLPCRLSDLISYTSGKKYQRLVNSLTKTPQQFTPDDYKDYLVTSNKSKSQLYCKVTRKLINDIPHHIQRHVTGKRFQRQLKLYKESLEKSSDDEEPTFWKPSGSDSDDEVDAEDDRLSDSFLDDDDGNIEQSKNSQKSDQKENSSKNTVDNKKPKIINSADNNKRQAVEETQTKRPNKKAKKQIDREPSRRQKKSKCKT